MFITFSLRSIVPRVTLLSQNRQLSLISRAGIRAIKENLDKPKQGVNGYGLFFQEKYTEFKRQFPNFSVIDIARRVGNAWNAMNPIDKQKYTDRAAKLGQQAKIDIAAYQDKLTPRQKLARRALYYHHQYSRGKVTRADIPKEIKEFVKNIPAAPFVTGRAMFMASKLRGQKEAVKMFSDVNKEWSKLSTVEKKTFDDRAMEDMKAFKQNLGKYIK